MKLGAAFDDALGRYERVVIIGSDAPTIPVGLIGTAFDALKHAPLALGPANDGGYCAIGASQSIRPSFERVRWSTAHALQDTVRANPDRDVATITPWYDIDEPNDLEVLRAHLSVDPAAAPATSRCLIELTRGQGSSVAQSRRGSVEASNAERARLAPADAHLSGERARGPRGSRQAPRHSTRG